MRNNKIKIQIILASILALVLLVPAQTFAQDYSGTLQIYVEGANTEHDYSLCGGELHELNISCLNFKGSEFPDIHGEYAYNGDTKVKVYGCAIDETADTFSCDSFWASPITKTKTMTLVVNQSSIIPLPSQMSEPAQTQLSQVSNIPTTTTTQWTNPETGLVYDIPMGDYCLDFNEDAICDIDFNDGKVVVYEDEDAADDNGNSNSNNNNNDEDDPPYCDQVSVYENCFDRKDYDQSSGLYPCKDGSYVEDWRDCNGGGSNNDNDNNDNDDEDAADEDAADEGEYEDDGYIDENGNGEYDEGEE